MSYTMKSRMMMLKHLLPDRAVKKGSRYFLSFKQQKDCIFQDTFLGEETDKGFQPSLHLLALHKDTLNTITLNDSNTWQFSLGKDATDCTAQTMRDKNSDLVLVLSGHNEIIGIAKKVTKKNGIVVYKNLWDIGYLLRREMDNKK